jgi:hypothetical protein
MSNAPTTRGTSAGRTLASAILIVLAVLSIGVGALTAWMKYQVLDTAQWTETSRETIQRPEVQDAVAIWTVDEVFKLLDPEDALAGVLPPRLAVLAGPITSRLRTESYDVAGKAMADPRIEDIWVNSNQRAHERFVRIVQGDDPIVVETTSGIRIDLRPMLEGIAERIGIDPKLVDRIPERVSQVTPKRTAGAERGLKVLRALDQWGSYITFLALPLLAGGIALATNRRKAWMWSGAGVIVVSIGLDLARDAIGPVVAELMADSTTWRAAILATWDVASEVLGEAARVGMFVGLLTILLAWSTGPGSWARGFRNAISPLLDRPALTVGIVAALMLLAFSQLPAFSDTRIGIKLVLLIGACCAGWMLTRAEREALLPAGDQATATETPTQAPDHTASTDT